MKIVVDAKAAMKLSIHFEPPGLIRTELKCRSSRRLLPTKHELKKSK